MNSIEGGVTAAQGFQAAGVSCGIKASDRQDLALVCSKVPAQRAAVFTNNLMAAAPVLVSRENVSKSRAARAVVANSGCANACTGAKGLEDARAMTALVGQELGVAPAEVIVASTGIIGSFLPMERVKSGIVQAVKNLTPDDHASAARAIMTTDTVPKEAAVEFSLQGTKAHLGGMAKGAGMIAPDMATMLAVLTTDVAIEKELLQNELKAAVEQSFNRITVDGDTSTNDMVCILANGANGGAKLGTGAALEVFSQALIQVCEELAHKIVVDGEGATKFLTITVAGALSVADAKKAALAIANSNLVKTAFFGQDPNWGRIMAALGSSGVPVDPLLVDVYLGSAQVAKAGVGTLMQTKQATDALSHRAVEVKVDLNVGHEEATVWTTDLSYDYIRLNAEYPT